MRPLLLLFRRCRCRRCCCALAASRRCALAAARGLRSRLRFLLWVHHQLGHAAVHHEFLACTGRSDAAGSSHERASPGPCLPRRRSPDLQQLPADPPVMKPARCGSARNRHSWATSSGRPTRPGGRRRGVDRRRPLAAAVGLLPRARDLPPPPPQRVQAPCAAHRALTRGMPLVVALADGQASSVDPAGQHRVHAHAPRQAHGLGMCEPQQARLGCGEGWRGGGWLGVSSWARAPLVCPLPACPQAGRLAEAACLPAAYASVPGSDCGGEEAAA